jgi:hypothetical protein
MPKLNLSLAGLILLFLTCSIAQAAGRDALPVSCQFKLDKEEIATGQRMKIWVWYFLDAERRLPMPNCRVVIYAQKGEILNGVQAATEPEGIKAFQVAGGVIELDYKAPEQCPEEPEKIWVYNSLDNLPISTRPMGLTRRHEKIGERGIKLICPQGLTLTQTILRRIESGGAMSLLEIKVKVRVKLDAMGGSAVALEDAQVAGFLGRCLYVTKDHRDEYHLASASVASMSGAFQIFRDDNGNIASISPPAMSVLLSWKGASGITPPGEIVVGPVRKPDEKQRKAHIKALRQARKRAEGKRPMEMYSEVMPLLQQVLTDNPDLQAVSGGKYSATGGGEINRPEPDGVDRESFKWRLVLQKR